MIETQMHGSTAAADRRISDMHTCKHMNMELISFGHRCSSAGFIEELGF